MTDDSNAAVSPDSDALWKPADESDSREATVDVSARQAPAADDRGGRVEHNSPWSPESTAVFDEVSTARRNADATTPPIDARAGGSRIEVNEPVTSAPTRRSRRRRWFAFVVVGVVSIVAIVIGRSVLTTDLVGDTAAQLETMSVDGNDAGVIARPADSLVPDPFAGADPRRLPAQLDQQWRAELADVSATGQTQLSVLDDGAVVAVFDDTSVADGQPASVIVLLDGIDGSERWRTPFDSQARSFDILGDFGDVIVFERLDTENRSVLGVSEQSGELLWVRETNDPGVHVRLEGTPLVARVSFTVNARLTFIDPNSGDEIARVPGRLFATDYLGTWYVRNSATVSKLDLRDGWSPPTPFGTLWVADSEPASVVDGQLIAIDDGRLERLDQDGAPTNVATIGAAGSGGFAGLDTGASFTQLSPMVDDSFVIVGPRSVFGAVLDESGDADVRWRATGSPIESRPTDRGLALVVATEGGGSQGVIDASTGAEITVVEMVPGSVDALRLVGNGVVVTRSAELGTERVGLDLDGNRLWSLVGDGPLEIGPGVVVTYAPSDAGVAITAYGDSPS